MRERKGFGDGVAEAAPAHAPSARVVPWTREQIDAWVDLRDENTRRWLRRSFISEEAKERVRWERQHIVRACPESDDYEKLVYRLRGVFQDKVSASEFASFTRESVERNVERAVAALWARSLSDERSEDATATPRGEERHPQ